MYDLIIKNGTVIDGSGAPAFQGDVAVKGGLIAAVAPRVDGDAAKTVDAGGLTVTPGFIDSHNHSDTRLLFGVTAALELEQGFTTQVTGHCGESPAPFFYGEWDTYKGLASDETIAALGKRCGDFHSFMDLVSGMELETNYAFYVGHNNIRGLVMDYSPDPATPEQLAQMQALLRQAMEAGALGMSTGLVYTPSVYAGTEELCRLAEVLAPYGGRYDTHIRSEGDAQVPSIAEALTIGRRGGVTTVISHLKVEGKHNEGNSENILRMIDEAVAAGQSVYADQYPFTQAGAALISQIPPEFAVDGKEALVARLQDADFRKRVEYAIFHPSGGFESSLYFCGYEGCIVMTGDGVTTLTDVAAARGVEPMEAIAQLLQETDGNILCAYLTQNESDMRRILAHPRVMLGTDCFDLPVRMDPEQHGGFLPRATASAVKRLALFRDDRIAPPEEAVRRITSMPAAAHGLPGVGLLKAGYRADICLLDYGRLNWHADLEYPFRRNEGVKSVYVGGVEAVHDGVCTGRKGGIVLRRAGTK